jgi:hypothetical protein
VGRFTAVSAEENRTPEESLIIEPSAEFNAAIEEGMQSLRNEPPVSLEEARAKIALWSAGSA